MSAYKMELFAKNFTCPDFHTCTLVDSLETCKEYLGAVCQSVSTHIAELGPKSCGLKGRGLCYEPTGNTYPGPDGVMAIVHHEWNEKAYNYVTENFTMLALGGLGAVVLAYGSYRLISYMTTPPKFIETANKDELQRLLQDADVSVGHWNGRQICFKGQGEKATFDQVSGRIEELYFESVRFMRDRQEAYDRIQDPRYAHGYLGVLINGVKAAFHKRPELSKEEEGQVLAAMGCRTNMYNQLDALLEQSQAKLNENTSYFGKLIRVWDKMLDKMISLRATPVKWDGELLEQMVKNRS